MNDQVEKSERKYVSTTMQNVIMSSSSRDNVRLSNDINLPPRNALDEFQPEARKSMQYSKNKQQTLINYETKPNTSSNRDHTYNKVSEESSGVVKRTKNIITSPERNSKPPTHETYHIEEML